MKNPTDFLLNTDYEMDKIIYFKSGSIMPGETKFINHNLGIAPLVFCTCSFSEDFDDSMPSPFLQFLLPTGFISFDIWANNQYTRIEYRNDQSSSQKLYFRIYAFEPSNTRISIGPTSNLSKQFVINTDYNYCKLLTKGVVNGDATITHNLGYVPFVLAWKEGPFGIAPESISRDDNYVEVTSTSVIIKNNTKTHYRIYCEEA